MSRIDRDIIPDPRLSLIDRHLPNTPQVQRLLRSWVDPVLFPPKILMLVGDQDGTCRIFNPASDYKLSLIDKTFSLAAGSRAYRCKTRADGFSVRVERPRPTLLMSQRFQPPGAQVLSVNQL